MTRVALACLALAFFAAPLGAEAQSAGRVSRIAYLSLAYGSTPRSEALREGLRALGYVEGQTIAIDYRWGSGKLDQLREQAAELVRLNVDIIVTGGPSATAIAKDATRMIPIVMAGGADPVTAGVVDSIARPGGNITVYRTRFPWTPS